MRDKHALARAESLDTGERLVESAYDIDDERARTGPLISAAHRDKAEAYVARGPAEGAVLRCGGARPTGPGFGEGFSCLPTVPDDCASGMPVVREESSGAVLTVERFRSEEEVRPANDTVYGVAGAARTGDEARAARVAAARHGLDQRLPPVRSAGRVGRLQTVRVRARARSGGARRVSRDEAHLAQHPSRTPGLVHLTSTPAPARATPPPSRGPPGVRS
ncbi:hypothetical protein SHO565_67860 [Streptomyces sp. HO565]